MAEDNSFNPEAAARESANSFTGKNTSEQDSGDSPSYIGGFVKSALSAIPESFGAPPMAGVPEFRQENPAGGLLSNLTGAAVPFAGAAKLAETIPAYKGFVEGAEAMGKGPVSKGALKSAATYAPLNAAQAAGQLSQGEDQKNVGTEAAINLGLEAGFGALGGIVTAGGRVIDPATRIAKDLTSLKGPAQQKIEELNTLISSGKLAPDQLSLAKNRLYNLEMDIRTEKYDPYNRGVKAVEELENGGRVQDLNRIFNESNSKGQVRTSLLFGSGLGNSAFKSGDLADSVSKAAGLTGNYEAVSMPRYVGFQQGADNMAKKIEDDFRIRAGFTSVDGSTYMGREKDGLYIMARKITGDLGNATDKDEWVVWKTDQPGRFVPGMQDYVNRDLARTAFMRQPWTKPTGNPLLNETDQLTQDLAKFQVPNYLAGMQKGLIGDTIDSVKKVFGGDTAAKDPYWVTQRAKELVDGLATPEMYQFRDNPLAKYVVWWSKNIKNTFQDTASKIIFGENKAATGSVLKQALGERQTTGQFLGKDSIQKLVAQASPEDYQSAIFASRRLVEMSEGLDDVAHHIDGMLAAGDITPSTAKLLHGLNEWDQYITPKIQALADHVGAKNFSPLAGHVMLSRTWEGDFRAAITNAAGEKVYVTGGQTPVIANARAQSYIDAAEKEGLTGLKLTTAKELDDAADYELSQQIWYKSQEFKTLSRIQAQIEKEPVKPITLAKERMGMEGYQTQYTQKQFLDKLAKHVTERFDYQSRLYRQFALSDEMQNLAKDPAWKSVKTRLDQLDGQQGTLGKMQNWGMDKLLSPWLGKNSATKIVDGVNSFSQEMSLGFLNLNYAAQNLCSFLQNVMPEIAYNTTGSISALQRDYFGSTLMLGTDGRPRGLMSFLEPVKITAKSMSQISSPDPWMKELQEQAIRKGVIDPKTRAEWIGDAASEKLGIKDALGNSDGWFKGIKYVSNFLPEKVERLTRLQAFTSGALVARDIMGLKDHGDIYNWAKQFTHRAMYEYSAVNRPVLFSGPAGRLFGQFKNWQAHYFSTMLQYAGEANRGNFQPLLWHLGSTAALGGMTALPLYGAADGISKLYNNKTLMDNFYTAYNGSSDSVYGNVHDAVFWGLPAFLGLNLTSSVNELGANPMRDAAAMMSFPNWQRAHDLGKAVGTAFDDWANTGINPAKNPAVRQQLAVALAPKLMQRYMSRTEDRVLSLRTGNQIESGLTPYEQLLYSVGMTPKNLAIDYAKQNELWANQDNMRAALTSMGRAWKEAQEHQDYDALMALTKQAMVKGIPVESIARSAETQKQKENTDLIKRQFKQLQTSQYSDMGI